MTVRPEKIGFADGGAQALAGQVVTRIFQGNHWLYQVDTAHGRVTVIRQNAGEPAPAEGEAVRLTWRQEDMSVRRGGDGAMSAAETDGSAGAGRRICCRRPGLLLFVGIVLVPLGMTVLLSFHDWGQYKGIETVFILKNWREIWSDGYFHEMFLRTFRIALLVTLMTARARRAGGLHPVAHERARGSGIFLLVVLGPLLISVVARTLGLGAAVRRHRRRRQQGAAEPRADLATPIPFMFTETGVVIALAHVLMPFMVLSVWAALQRLDPQIENAALSLGAVQIDGAAAHRAAADHAGHPVGRDHRVRAGGQRLRDAGDHRRAAAEGGVDARL